MKRAISIVLLVIFLGVFVYSGYSLINYMLESKEQFNQFNDLAQIKENSRQNAATAPHAPNNADSVDPTGDEEEPTEFLVSVTDPDTGEEVLILPEYADLYLLNNDLIGWIELEDSYINYPVMQRPESRDFYLYRGYDRQYLGCGTLYAKEECDVFEPSDNITLYGHYMYNNAMFHDLHRFTEREYWQTHKTFTFDTLRSHNTYEIVTIFKTTANEGGFPYYRFIDAQDEADFDNFIAECKSREFYDTGVTVEYGDKLVCLSTCEYTLDNGRLVVLAKRIDN